MRRNDADRIERLGGLVARAFAHPCFLGLKVQALAAAIVVSSYTPVIGPSYAPFSFSTHWSARTFLIVEPGTMVG